MPKVDRPKIVGRGGTGLLNKLTEEQRKGIVLREGADKPILEVENVPNKINPALKALVVSISSLVPDPMNARVHNERNTEATMESLKRYGQLKPIVVRKSDRVIMAGNGTTEAAKKLGWTKIAAVITNLSKIDSMGYGLADNRSAELARWNQERVAIIDKLLQDEGHPTIGWSEDEVSVIRMADFTPVAISDEEFSSDKGLTVKFLPEHSELITKALDKYRRVVNDLEVENPDCILGIMKRWLAMFRVKK